MKRLLSIISLLALSALACTDGQSAANRAELHAAAGWGARGGRGRAQSDSSFARLVERLSEPGGYFDTDNLISNETSYLHVLDGVRELGVSGGAYIGVGPDQNFSYIAEIRPAIAFIIDIRRDNLLQHLLFKSLFSLSRNRIEYLCLLLGRPLPNEPEAWYEADIGQLVRYIDANPAEPSLAEERRGAIEEQAGSFGLPLTPQDVGTIRRIHERFVSAGLDLRFSSHGRSPRPYYPNFRQLLLETDRSGNQANYLASEDDFRFVKSLQERDQIIPVVGDLAGDHALRAIGRYVDERGERVSAFYTSNVEFYLMRNGSFDRFADNVSQLPHDERSVIIRSYFGGMYRYPHPLAVPGYYSTQLLQTMESLAEQHADGGYESYWQLVNEFALQPG